MQRVNLDRDIQPLSAFRANAASFIERVRASKRPVVLTQHGRSAAVLVDVAEYDALLERIEVLEDIQTAEHQIEEGQGTLHAAAKERIMERLGG